jgi:putative transposase
MSMQRAFQYRIYPTKDQQEFLARQFGAVRFVYNRFLSNRKDEYLNNKKSLNYYDDAKSLTELKSQDGYEWLYEINSQTLQASLRNLEVSYQNFFKKRAKFPRFHSRKNKQCIKIPQHFKIEDCSLRGDKIEDHKLFIPKLKEGIEIILHRDLPKKQTCCFISKTSSDRYYVSFLCEVEIEPLEKSDSIIGIDLGIKSLIVSSNGQVIENKNFYKRSEKKLAYDQRQLSKKKLGSSNRNKQRKEVAKINEYIANCRKDYLHKVSKKLIDENQVIITESLSVKNMMSNHYLAKSITDASWSELLRQLEYKANWYGRTFYQIYKFFPSSKTCNHCQFVLDDLPLSIREWNCPNCKEQNDRDLNAALNIRDKGMKDLSGLGINSDIKQKLVERLPKATLRSKKPLALC